MLHLLDLGTRKFWRLTGREVDLDGHERWLDGPMSATSRVAADWVAHESVRRGGPPAVVEDGAGLLPSTAVLDGPGFDSSCLRPEVRDFYEHTSGWQMEVWTGWSPLFWPGGEVVSRVWGRRVEQLALPMHPLDVARGMDSRITPIRDAQGAQVATAWTRTLRADGRPVFSGAYAAGSVPASAGPRVHVAFPLESGNLQVFLRPTVTDDGGLLLESPPGRFGDDGAYVVVRDGGRTHAARLPLHETFHVFVDGDGVLRTDHELRLWGASAVRLHYRLDRCR